MYNFSYFNLGQWKQYTIHVFHYCSHVLCSLKFLIIIFYSSHGDFVTIIDLPEGEHQYKFYVDGEWKHDPGVVCVWNKIKRAYWNVFFAVDFFILSFIFLQRIVDNEMGSKNNLVSVKKSDFEVFQALDMDSESMGSNQQRK